MIIIISISTVITLILSSLISSLHFQQKQIRAMIIIDNKDTNPLFSPFTNSAEVLQCHKVCAPKLFAIFLGYMEYKKNSPTDWFFLRISWEAAENFIVCFYFLHYLSIVALKTLFKGFYSFAAFAYNFFYSPSSDTARGRKDQVSVEPSMSSGNIPMPSTAIPGCPVLSHMSLKHDIVLFIGFCRSNLAEPNRMQRLFCSLGGARYKPRHPFTQAFQFYPGIECMSRTGER